MRRTIGRIYSRVWSGEGFPEKWRKGVIVSIVKKRRVKRVDEHRGTALMPTAYKVYAAMLAERLRREIKEKGILPKGQVRFGKGREVIDNIYILNYVVKREIVIEIVREK